MEVKPNDYQKRFQDILHIETPDENQPKDPGIAERKVRPTMIIMRHLLRVPPYVRTSLS